MTFTYIYDLLGWTYWAAFNPFRFATEYQETSGTYAGRDTGLYYDKNRYYIPAMGRFANRDPIGEAGGPNLYAYCFNDGVNFYDPDGLDAATDPNLSTFVAKSFINGIGQVGSLNSDNHGNGRPGMNPIGGPPTPGNQADARLAQFINGVKNLPAFNEDPQTDAKDGNYRLYTQVAINACVSGSNLTVTLKTDSDGGNELPGVAGTISMSSTQRKIGPGEVEVEWIGSGHPNDLVEPGMQMVAYRTSVNIWHDVTVDVKAVNGKPQFKLKSVNQSAFPSVRVWQDSGSKPVYDYVQGPISDLWESDPNNPGIVAPPVRVP